MIPLSLEFDAPIQDFKFFWPQEGLHFYGLWDGGWWGDILSNHVQLIYMPYGFCELVRFSALLGFVILSYQSKATSKIRTRQTQ